MSKLEQELQREYGEIIPDVFHGLAESETQIQQSYGQ